MKTRLLTVALIAALGTLAACSGRSDEDLLAAANKRIAENDPAGATIELKNLLQSNPDNIDARRMLGKALLDSGDLAGAEIELRRAWELGGPRDLLAPLIAQTQLNAGQSRKLISDFGDQGLADPKAMGELQALLAHAYLNVGNLEEAKVASGKALQFAPDAETSVMAGARVQAASGSRDEALRMLDGLLASKPKSVKALLLKADLLTIAGRPAEVPDLLRQVLVIEPGSFEARNVLLRQALGEQKLDEATKLVEAIPATHAKRPLGRFMQAQLALAKGDASKARDLAEPLLKILPEYLPLLRLMSGTYQQLGNMAEAQALLGQALKLAPEDGGLRRQFANLQLQNRAPAQALEALKPMLESGRIDAESLLIAGRSQMLLGQFQAADASFAAAAKLRPEDAKTQAALALSALAREVVAPGTGGRAKADAAVGRLRELAAKDSGNSYDLMLINALMRRQELPAALAAIDKLAAKTPASAIPATLRGRVQFSQKQFKEARASFEAAFKADAAYLPATLGLVGMDQQEGKGEDGVKRLEAYIAAQPQTAVARLALAELLGQLRAPAQRIATVLSDGVRQEPTDASLRLALIDHRLRQGEGPAAAQAAQEAATAMPNNPDILERLARSQMMSQDKAQALKSYTRLTALAPTRAMGFLGLAQLRFIDQDFAGAEREVKRALEAEPVSQAAQRLLIQLAIRQNRLDEALAALAKRQKDQPQEAFAFVAQADIEFAQKKPDAALASLRKAVAVREFGDAPVRLFAALMGQKKRDEALAFEKQWLQAHPGDRVFATGAADILLARGEFEPALERYEGLLAKAPDALAVINNLAWLRSKTGKGNAVELAERGLKLNPDFEPLRDTYSTVLAGAKQFDKAIRLQRQVVLDFPAQPAYKLNLAEILIASGDKPGAKSELEALAALGAKFPQQARVTELLKTL